MNRTQFQMKLNYLFKQLNVSENKFIELFSPSKYNQSARKKVVIKKWLRGDMKENPRWKFDTYPISKYHLNNIQIFTEKSLIEDSLNAFKDRVDSYITNTLYHIENKFDFEYRYIYYFDKQEEKILNFEIEIIEEVYPKKEYRVKITPPHIYLDRVTPYIGRLKISSDGYYLLSATNSFETISSYFLANKGVSLNNNYLYGITLGLSYDRKLPLANKNIITQSLVDEDEKSSFYLLLNEIDYIFLDDEFYNGLTQKRYMNKFHSTLSKLVLFRNHSRDIFKDIITENVYTNIFHKKLLGLNEVSQHIKNRRKYFISGRRTTTKIFLENMFLRKENTVCYIVYPLINKDAILFDKYDINSKKSLSLNIKLAQQGLKIERIFILDDNYIISDYIKKSVKQMENSGITVQFVEKEILNNLHLENYDFIYSQEKDVALYRSLNDKLCSFTVTTLKKKIKRLDTTFFEIKKLSLPLDKFIIRQPRDKILKNLTGKWYHYFYGSLKDKNGQIKLWKDKVYISNNRKVEYIYLDKIILEGEINTKFNPNQIFIYLTEVDSKNLSLISFDKQDIYKKIFKVSLLDKKLSTYYNMASFGFFSREKLSDSIILSILEEDSSATLLDNKIDNRINQYLNQE
jgi:hypothetical protein